MQPSQATTLPLLPPSLWLGVESLTLAGSLAAHRQRSARLEAGAWGARLVIDDAPAGVAMALLGVGCLLEAPCRPPGSACPETRRVSVCGVDAPNPWPREEVRRLPGFSARYDLGYLGDVVDGICGSRSPSTMTLDELAEDLARAICTGCPSMGKPVQPLVLARVEFYRFSRSFGGSRATGADFDVAKRLGLPAAAQAIALLAHYAATIYRAGDSSLSLALAPESLAPSLSRPSTLREAVEYYARARCTLSRAARAWGGDPPGSIVSLLAAVEAAELHARGLAGFDPDSLILARFSLGRRPTLQRADILPVASLAHLIEEAGFSLAPARGAPGLFKAIGASARRLAIDAAATRAGAGDAERLDAARRMLVEYSTYMLEASFKLASCRQPVEEAYAASRLMEHAARILAGASSQAVRGFADDAGLLSRLASAAASARPPRPCGPISSSP